MLLFQLNKNEKEAYINLSTFAMNSNGIAHDAQKLMIKEYLKEINLDEDNYPKMNMDSIVHTFKSSSDTHKKNVLAEVIGLLYSDAELDTDEAEFLYKYSNEVGLSKETVDEAVKLIKNYLIALNDISEFIAK